MPGPMEAEESGGGPGTTGAPRHASSTSSRKALQPRISGVLGLGSLKGDMDRGIDIDVDLDIDIDIDVDLDIDIDIDLDIDLDLDIDIDVDADVDVDIDRGAGFHFGTPWASLKGFRLLFTGFGVDIRPV